MLAGGALPVVAAFTGAEHLGMIHGDHRLPEIHRVAVFTDVRGQQVLRGFPGCFDSVVATDTAGGDAIMIEDHGRPAHIRMARIALLGRLHVIRGHAFGSSTVVAARAGAEHLRMIHHGNRHPVGNDMAGLAVFRRDRMIDGSGGFGIDARAVVTESALPGGSLEQTACMTGFTGYRPVRALQIESGLEMIERLRGGECLPDP